MLRAGAVGYVVKGGSSEDITDAIHRAAVGQSALSAGVTADVIREYRSFHGTTSTVTLTPLAALNFSSSGFRMAASSSRLAAWLVAHQVISLLSELAAPALEPELLEPDEPHAVRAVAARTAAAAALTRLVCFIYSNLL